MVDTDRFFLIRLFYKVLTDFLLRLFYKVLSNKRAYMGCVKTMRSRVVTVQSKHFLEIIIKKKNPSVHYAVF